MSSAKILSDLRMSTLACGYTACVILSSPFGRVAYQFLVETIGRSGVGFLIWLLFFMLAGVVLSALHGMRTNALWRTVIIVAVGFLYAASFEIIEERMHLVLFGTLGWFAARDNPQLSARFTLLLAMVLGLTIGTVDELLQHITPNRVGDWRDVGFNILGAMWGAALWIANRSRG